MADIPRSIRMMEENGMTVEIIGETSGPFRSYYFEEKKYMKEMASLSAAYSLREGIRHERLIVFKAT